MEAIQESAYPAGSQNISLGSMTETTIIHLCSAIRQEPIVEDWLMKHVETQEALWELAQIRNAMVTA